MKKVPTEIYSRVVGYFRPVNNWNNGKQEEFNERKMQIVDDNIVQRIIEKKQYKRMGKN